MAAQVADYDPDEVGVLEPASLSAHERLATWPRVRLVRGSLFLTHPD